MSNTDAHIAKLHPYVKSLRADAADALGCWPADVCHRDFRNMPRLRDCDCYFCTRTMQERATQHREYWAHAHRIGKVRRHPRTIKTGRTVLRDGERVPVIERTRP